jgi:hypothetical protein
MLQQSRTTRRHRPLSHARFSLMQLARFLNVGPMKRVRFDVVLKERKPIAEGTMVFSFTKPVGFHFRAGQHLRGTLLHPVKSENGSERAATVHFRRIPRDRSPASLVCSSQHWQSRERG